MHHRPQRQCDQHRWHSRQAHVHSVRPLRLFSEQLTVIVIAVGAATLEIRVDPPSGARHRLIQRPTMPMAAGDRRHHDQAEPIGKALLLDSSKAGYIGVREPVSVRTGGANDDLVKDIQRFVGKERLVLCCTRPAAVLALSGL